MSDDFFEVPDWTVDEFLETRLGVAATELEDRMSMALGEEFVEGNVSDKLDLLFEGLADVQEVAYYCHRVAIIYGADVLQASTGIHAALQGAVSQAICLGIMLERNNR